METLSQSNTISATLMLPPHFIVIMLLSIIILLVLANALFAYSIYKTARLIPKRNHRFPIGLLWLFLIPVINSIFQILLLVFDLPRGLRLTFSDNAEVVARANTLFNIGVVFAVLFVASWLVGDFLSIVFSVINLVLMSIYWVKIVAVRRYCT